MNRVKGKVAVVTGGAMGIGRAGCLLLAAEGAEVAVTDINPAGEKVAAEIREKGGTAQFWPMNTASEKDVEQTFKEIIAHFKRINVLVNNAGIAGVSKPTHEITEAEWDSVMQINIKGVFLCTKHVIPYMRQAKGGAIINMSSVYGMVGAGNTPPYHASKGAVRIMTKNDAMLYAKDKIRVNSIHPGAIWTPLLEAAAAGIKGGREVFSSYMTSLHPLGHLGEPEDIGWGIVYLASDESRFMTGSELVIDGGYTAK